MALDGAAVLAFFKWPAAIAGGSVGVVIVATAFGFSVTGPGAVMAEYQEEHVVEHVIIDDTLTDIDRHMEAQQILLEAVVRGECIENPKENLQRQGLIEKCSELGIER
ncbi:hypothetical protein LCGC14_1033590 [marine sediment metagenome]|uniref:Uncharacterized protein n=1 Tax=marine sediment metagenome TaxID=412755 RepID=A0A0F9NFH5_9ZZZZ